MSEYKIMRLSGPFPWTLLNEHGPVHLHDHERTAFHARYTYSDRGRMNANSNTFGLKTRKAARSCVRWLNAVRAVDTKVVEGRVLALVPDCPSEHAILQLRNAVKAAMAASVPIPPDPNETKE